MTIATTTRTRLLASAAVLAVAVVLPVFAGPAQAKLVGGFQLAQAATGSGSNTLSPSTNTGAPLPSTNPASPTAPAEKVAPPASTTTPALGGASTSASKSSTSNTAANTAGSGSTASPAASGGRQPSAADTASGKGSPAKSQARIENLKSQLKITSAQMPEWNALAQVMADNQQQMEQLYHDRRAKGANMTAVDDLDSYAKITDAQADNLKKLVPAFQALYTKMSPDQKKTADTLFRRNGRRSGPSHASAKSPAKTAPSATHS